MCSINMSIELDLGGTWGLGRPAETEETPDLQAFHFSPNQSNKCETYLCEPCKDTLRQLTKTDRPHLRPHADQLLVKLSNRERKVLRKRSFQT